MKHLNKIIKETNITTLNEYIINESLIMALCGICAGALALFGLWKGKKTKYKDASNKFWGNYSDSAFDYDTKVKPGQTEFMIGYSEKMVKDFIQKSNPDTKKKTGLYKLQEYSKELGKAMFYNFNKDNFYIFLQDKEHIYAVIWMCSTVWKIDKKVNEDAIQDKKQAFAKKYGKKTIAIQCIDVMPNADLNFVIDILKEKLPSIIKQLGYKYFTCYLTDKKYSDEEIVKISEALDLNEIDGLPGIYTNVDMTEDSDKEDSEDSDEKDSEDSDKKDSPLVKDVANYILSLDDGLNIKDKIRDKYRIDDEIELNNILRDLQSKGIISKGKYTKQGKHYNILVDNDDELNDKFKNEEE